MTSSKRFRLDSRCVKAWRAAAFLTTLPIAVLALIAGTSFLIGMPGWTTTSSVVGVWCVLVLIAVVAIGPLPAWAYRHWSYRINVESVELRHGIVWQSSVSIPVSRLQHIDLHVGPLERRLGLASLELHTAGTRNASQTIPGLNRETAEQIRDQLVEASGKRRST